MPHSLLNKPAPKNISLKNQDGESVDLGSFLGQGPAVVFFYPKDESYGCTKQACSFRDSYQVFQDAGATLVGISSDSSDSHKRFATAQKLQFPLLADVKGEAKKAFEVSKTFGIIPGRVTFLIDREGIVRDVFDSQMDFNGHVTRAVSFVEEQAATKA
ncbi:hypothetical protein G9A89_017168 [Geosiphon pyriformis]|nr:hypothetical protein G9A89_017168 [Geosiphon pyriformis]